MPIKEGLSGSNGFGTVAVMKNAPHPNASKVYINWLLGKEGQDLYGKALTPGTRRFDVDTKWLAEIDSSAAKDVMTPEHSRKFASMVKTSSPNGVIQAVNSQEKS